MAAGENVEETTTVLGMSAACGPMPPFMARNHESLELYQSSSTAAGLPALSLTLMFMLSAVITAQLFTLLSENLAQPHSSELSARPANSVGSAMVMGVM